MGYCVRVSFDSIVIPAEKVADCLKAINALHDPELLKKQAGGGSSSGERWYSWVGNSGEGGFPTLVEAFDEWRYQADLLDSGNVVCNYFTGEKLGDDAILFKAIAPFVQDGAEIYFRGEDDAHWKYVFKGGEVNEVWAQLKWDDEDEDS